MTRSAVPLPRVNAAQVKAADHHMARCWLSEGDALRAMLCAAGFSIRWLLRAIVRPSLDGRIFVLTLLAFIGQWTTMALAITVGLSRPSTPCERQVRAATG